MNRAATVCRFLGAIVFAVLAIQSPAGMPTRQTSRAAERPLIREYGKLPLAFEPNLGQTDERVRFLARGGGMTAFFTDAETVMLLSRSGEQAVVRMKLAGAGGPGRAIGLEKLPGISNYFLGNDPSKWRTDVPHYGRIQFAGVYPGIDLVWYGNQRRLEYDFVVAPGADAKQIQVAYEGVESVAVEAGGELVLRTALGEVRQQRPRVYQEMGGKRVEVGARYEILARNRVRFELARYDRKRELRIDPVVLVYSTYLGGSGSDGGGGIAVDAAGSVYVTGTAGSSNFPTQSGYQAKLTGGSDVFVTKLTPAGNALVYSTYLGGSGNDVGYGIAVDGAGAAYVTGYTQSTNFPTQTPYQTYQGGAFAADVFVAKLAPAGNALVYSTYLGGTSDDIAYAIAVDAAGSAYVTGETDSTNFPTQSAYQATSLNTKFIHAFVTKLTPAGSALAYSTYLGGSGFDAGAGIVVDGAGSAYVTGITGSSDFPTQSPYQATLQGGSDAFITKLTPAGNALVYSTFLGGSRDDAANAIAVDGTGAAYVTGYANSTNFPTKSAYQAAALNSSSADAFVTKLTPAGNALVYSTYLGGAFVDSGTGIAVDGAGSAYVTGYTQSADFPTQSPYLGGNQGGNDAFVTKLTPAGNALVYSTFLGGSGSDLGSGIAVDGAGAAYVTGNTISANFPTQSGYQATSQGGGDAFVTKLQLGAGPQITLAGIGSAANYVAGKVSPGEIIVVYGYSFGPSALAQLQYVNGVATNTLGGTRIYFDNVAAPMIYAIAGAPGVLSCVVPYGVKTSTQVVVEYNGVKGNTLTVPVVDAVPGIFSLNQSGTGAGAILNYPDYSVNGASNRVAAGGYIMAYATGEGKTDIATDGQHVPLLGPYPKPLLAPWTATVGGKPAAVTYSGSAPDNVAGVFQVNVQIPSDLTTGVYDLVIKGGGFSSTAGLTVAVK